MSLGSFVRKDAHRADQVVADHETDNPNTAGQVRIAVGRLLVEDGLKGIENPHAKKKKVTRLGMVGVVVGLIIGLGVVALGVKTYAAAPDTDQVVAGQVDHVGERHYSSSSGKRSSNKPSCAATATYAVNGTTYTAYGNGRHSEFCRLSIGDSIDVHYVSTDPDVSYIGPSKKKDGVWFTGIGLVVILVFLAVGSIRITSILHGNALIRSGRAMVAQHPHAAQNAPALAEAAKSALIARLRGGSDSDPDGAPLFPAPEQPATAPVDAPAPAAQITPGWYATADGAHERWHDGTRWTDHTRPTGAPA